MLENHLWTDSVGEDGSVGESGGVSRVSDRFRPCLTDLERISPLKLSTALFLLEEESEDQSDSMITVSRLDS